ncbi:MAG: hypothetical protein MJ245_04255, partial [Clostridia bacterium]|nr:hypothetical protein [Clostridia bacterium]
MQRSTTKTFTTQVKLALTDTHKAFLEKTFYYAEIIYNLCTKYAMKQIRKLEMDSRYKGAKGKERTNLINEYNLNQSGLYAYSKNIGKKYKKYLDSITVQSIADRVLVSVQKYLYKNGKRLHFKRHGELDTIQGKTNINKLNYNVEKNIVRFMNMKMKVRNNDLKSSYIKEALKNRIKFVMIKRLPFNNGYRYYLQIFFEGIAPNKKVKDVDGNVGIDIGTSTIAVCSKDKCILKELAPKSKKYLVKLNNVIIKMEHSRRINNPENFNEDGTVKHGHLTWHNSHNYKKLLWRLKTLHRKRSSYVKCEHEKLANEIISMGNNINVERMSFSGLQRKARLSMKENGTYKRRKRFGKSLLSKSPALLISIIDRKLGYIDKFINEVDTNT